MSFNQLIFLSGAGPSWNGCSGVHTHMTNTRITDPEILEKRYPIILRKFSLRNNSGGNGLFKGGSGVIRQLEFRQVSYNSIYRCFFVEKFEYFVFSYLMKLYLL